ncbi:related to RTT103 Regulator of Ty1 Transposition [Cephalotrichum gorgonifer]|uniref:Related to RTT103 Regulator of Ty1 Transposition n=1 Tax=Cephalotrichum gorgonifer TaxID=2041049 RepID=A0AAE8MRF4_9PEZI|nr:related to RTT103 Regulator of Ty1 Transposition [Cephalotrichum gorgonifer]
MAYNDDAVLAKLSAVNESHDSISSSAQWILFHRRHATRTVELWFGRLKTSSSTKKLSLVYLANELAQQSKIRNRMEFIDAFAPVMAEAIRLAYKGAPGDVQSKLRRVVDVWRDRQVFERSIQDAIDARMADLDKLRGSSAAFGGSPFGTAAPSVPPQLSPLVASFQDSVKLQAPANATSATASQEYTKITDPSAPVPSAPVYAARLNGLMKILASAEGAVAESVKARKSLIDVLEKLLDENKTALAADEEQLSQLAGRKTEIEQKKQDVETRIMQGLSANPDAKNSPTEGPPASTTPSEPDRPEMEALTPPSVQDEPELPEDATSSFPQQTSGQGSAFQQHQQHQHGSAPGIEMLSHLASQYQSLPVVTNGSNKRRRVAEGDEEFPGLGTGDDGIDADVAEMLRKDSTSN